MGTESTAVKIAELARRLERLTLEVQELKAVYADAPGRGALRTRAWREAYERTRLEMAQPASEEE